MNIFRKRTVDELCETSFRETPFQRELHAWQLILLGVGCIVGAGIFVLTGGVVCRSGNRHLIRYLGFGLSLYRTLLRRICIDASSGRERLCLCLRRVGVKTTRPGESVF